jgi:membrane-associated phospholipid phosphatase
VVLAGGDDPPMKASDPAPSTWSMVVYSLTRPYPVSMPLIVFLLLVPCYLLIGDLTSGRAVHVPALPWDRIVPLEPAWALVYGSLYLFLIFLPVFVVRQPDHIRATVWAYLLVWGVAYICFLVYPTVAPRPTEVVGTGFVDWGLRFLYTADTPYNCFPSIHVAHSFVSALTCYRVHRRVGVAATVCAALVAVSTLFAKQHYIVDVLAGIALAGVAYVLFLRNRAREDVPELDRRLAPVFAAGTVVVVGTAIACFWLAYRVSGGA